MGLLDRLLGRPDRTEQVPQLAPEGSAGPVSTEDPFRDERDERFRKDTPARTAHDDDAALARYRYLLRTAPRSRSNRRTSRPSRR